VGHDPVDDVRGVILDVDVTTGEANEGGEIEGQADAVAAATGAAIKDHHRLWQGLWRSGAAWDRPGDPGEEGVDRIRVPLRRFRYDARHDILKFAKGRILRPTRRVEHGRLFYSKPNDCRDRPMQGGCLSPGRVNKRCGERRSSCQMRARRRKERWSAEDAWLYQRHRWRSEGFHGEAKCWHGLARAIRRGLQNMRVQAFLTAMAVNLKRLAAALALFLAPCWGSWLLWWANTEWPKLGGFIDESETDVLAHMDFPCQHRTKIHSTNPLERLNKEVNAAPTWLRYSKRKCNHLAHRRCAARGQRRIATPPPLHADRSHGRIDTATDRHRSTPISIAAA